MSNSNIFNAKTKKRGGGGEMVVVDVFLLGIFPTPGNPACHELL